MEGITTKGIQILEEDTEGNLKPSRGLVVAQRITIDWEKDKIQKAYAKDMKVKQLRKQKAKDDNIQEREEILY